MFRSKYGSRTMSVRSLHMVRLQARAVLRDVGRVLQMPFGQVDKLCKMVPMKGAVSVSLPEALEQEPRLTEARRGRGDC